MGFYHDNAIIKHGIDTREVDIDFQDNIIVGEFVNKEKPHFLEKRSEFLQQKLGNKYVPYLGPNGNKTIIKPEAE